MEEAISLPNGPGSRSVVKIVATIFMTFVGAGILGLPFAFMEAGIVGGILIMFFVGSVSIKGMLLVIDCKYELIQKNNRVLSTDADKEKLISNTDSLDVEHHTKGGPDVNELTFGEVGEYAIGRLGKKFVDTAIVVSQIGFCAGYLIFISENLASYSNVFKKWHIVLMLLPGLWLLTLLRHMSSLAITSLLGQLSNFVAFGVVFWFDIDRIRLSKSIRPNLVAVEHLPFFFCIAVYCYAAAGMILSVEQSLAIDIRPKFKQYFGWSLLAVSLLYIVFGASGYLAYGSDTCNIITMNLPEGSGVDSAMVVKCCLCISLFFVYPMAMFPATQILERKLLTISETRYFPGNILRLVTVLVTGLIVLVVPNFTNLLALIGATCCTMLAFVLPGLFHLKIHAGSLTRKQQCFDYFLIVLGIFAACVGTFDAIVRMRMGTIHTLPAWIRNQSLSTLDPDVVDLFSVTRIMDDY